MAQTEKEDAERHLSAVEAEPEAQDNNVKSEGKVSFEATMELEEAISYFEAIVSGLKKGAIDFRQGEDHISLAPASTLKVKVKASSKKSKGKVSFELAWREAEEEEEREDLEIN